MVAAAMGWVGTIGTIAAYVMLSRGFLHADSLRYSLLNGVGGLLGATASAAYGAWPSVFANLMWSAVAAHATVVALRRRRDRRRADRRGEIRIAPAPVLEAA